MVHPPRPADGERAELDIAGEIGTVIVVPLGHAIGVHDLNGELQLGAAGKFPEVGIEQVVVADHARLGQRGFFPRRAIVGGVDDFASGGGVFRVGLDIDPKITGRGDLALLRKTDHVADPRDERLTKLGGVKGPSRTACFVDNGNRRGVAERHGQRGGDTGERTSVSPDAIRPGGHGHKLLHPAVDFQTDLDRSRRALERAVVRHVGDGDVGGTGGRAGLGGFRESPGDENLGVFARETESDAAAVDGDFFRRIEDVGELGAVGFGHLGIHGGDGVVRGVEGHERLLLEQHAAERISAGGTALPALGEGSARQRRVIFAGGVEFCDVLVERRIGGRQLVALRRAGLEAAVEHRFALPVGVVILQAFVLLAGVLTVEVVALVEGVLGAVIETGHGCGEVEEGERGAQFPDVVGRVAGILDTDAVDVVVVDEGDKPVLAFAVLCFGVERLGELTGPLPVDKDALDRLAHREEERGVEGISGLFAVAGQRGVVIDEQFAEEDKVVFALGDRVFADVVRPLFHPIVFHVLDRIDAEAVAVGGVDEIFESLRDPISDVSAVGGQIVRAPELALQGFREGIPVVDRSVPVERGQLVEGVRMLAVGIPPTE